MDLSNRKESEREEKDGVKWLFFAGGAAVVLSLFLYYVDEYMSSASAREQQHNALLRQLRLAQTTLDSRSTDTRQVGEGS